MDIRVAGSIAIGRAPANAFSGRMWHATIVDAPLPAWVRAVRVSFEPGARTACHTHLLGQTRHVISRGGRVQTFGWSCPGDPAARRRLDPAGRGTLAGSSRHLDGAYVCRAV